MVWAALAEARRAVEGTQPVHRQAARMRPRPPTATCRPKEAANSADTIPPEPMPTMTRSYRCATERHCTAPPSHRWDRYPRRPTARSTPHRPLDPPLARPAARSTNRLFSLLAPGAESGCCRGPKMVVRGEGQIPLEPPEAVLSG